MVIDSSAVVAILLNEPEADWFESAIFDDPVLAISAASIVETFIVLDRRSGIRATSRLDGFIIRTNLKIIPVTVEQSEVARQAFRRFGRGRHKAALNFGDCFTYALAKVSRESLLCKGNDFAHTDLTVISPPPSPQST